VVEDGNEELVVPLEAHRGAGAHAPANRRDPVGDARELVRAPRELQRLAVDRRERPSSGPRDHVLELVLLAEGDEVGEAARLRCAIHRSATGAMAG
jgi:hypothetical protein